MEYAKRIIKMTKLYNEDAACLEDIWVFEPNVYGKNPGQFVKLIRKNATLKHWTTIGGSRVPPAHVLLTFNGHPCVIFYKTK